MSLSIRIQHRFSDAFHLDVDVESHDRFIGITGPSGSGKTSALHIVAGIQVSDSAHIELDGALLHTAPPAHRGVGLVMQSPHLFPHLNVEQNLLFGARASPDQASLEECIEWLEIAHLLHRPVRHLSGGERQRVALGRAVLSNPKLLLLDEPFSAIDGDRTQRIIGHLKRHSERSEITVIWVSHNVELLLHSADTVLTMSDGRISGTNRSTP